MIQYSTGQIVDPGLMRRDVILTYRYDPVVHPHPHRAAEAGQRQVSHGFVVVVEALLYVHRNRRLVRDGSPGRPPRLSHSREKSTRVRSHARRESVRSGTEEASEDSRAFLRQTRSNLERFRTASPGVWGPL